jgi:hypothetical protein
MPYVIYRITRDGNMQALHETDTFEELRFHALKYGYRCSQDVFYGMCNTERQDIGMEDGLTDEERENLPPGL